MLWTKARVVAPTQACIKLYVQLSTALVEGHDIDTPNAMIDPAFAPTQEGKYGLDPLQFVAYACKEKLFTAKVKVKGLQPNTKYYYRFKYYEFNTTVSGGAADRPPIDHQWGYPAMTQVGQFKTLPSPGEHVESFKIGVLGCSAPFNGIFNSYYQLAKLEPDLVIHTSDYTYADSNAYEAGNILTPTELLKYPNTQLGVPHYMPESVAEYSLYYDRMHVEPDVQELHRKAAWVLNIGDHELSNDWDVTQYGTNWANYLNHGGKKSYEEVMEAGTQAWLLNLPVDDIDGRLSPAFDSRLEGFVADPAWDDVDKKSPKFHVDKDWAGHIGDLAYFHVLDDYSDVDLIDYQDIVKNDDGSFGVYYKNCDDTQGIREGFVKRPCMDKIDPKEDPQVYKDILKVYDKYYLKTSRISHDQMKRIESGFAAAAETTWKLTSVGVPQTVFHALIAGGELPPDYGKPYDVFVWPQNSYTANL